MKIKKVLLIVLLSVAIVMSTFNIVYADSLSVKMIPDNSSYKRGETVTVNVQLTNIDSTEGIYGLGGVLAYDKDVFEPIVATSNGKITSVDSYITEKGGWSDFTFNSNTNDFSILTTTPATNSLSIMEIKLKVKSDAKLGSTIIMLNDLEATNNIVDIPTSAESISVNIVEDEIPVINTTPTPTPSIDPSPVATPKATTTPTTTKGNLPQTGINDFIVPVVVGAVMISVGTFIVYIRYKDVK